MEEAKIWMERYFHLIGDKQPDKNKVHLGKKDYVYNRYKEDTKETTRVKLKLEKKQLLGKDHQVQELKEHLSKME